MARLNRSSLPFIGLLVSWGMASTIGCLETSGLPKDTTSGAGGSGGAAGAGGTAGMGGEAGTGGGMLCEPGSTKACYSGPIETTNIGSCKPGTQTCLADGTGYDASCVGEVLPGTEDCAAMGDEDCDGLADLLDVDECKCTPLMISPCDTQLLGACAAGTGLCSADGRSIDSCVQTNLPSPESCVTPEDDDCDGTAAAACTGEPKWIYTTTGTTDDSIFAVAPTPDGGYAIAGVVDGAIANTDGGITAGTIYVAKLDAAGAMQWEKKYFCSTLGAARGVAADAAGNIIVVGEFEGTVQLDGSNDVTSTDNASDIFMLKLDSAGMHVWHKALGDTDDQVALDVGVDSNGNIFITGYADTDPFTLGGDTLDPNNIDVFVASFDGGGNHKWSKLYINPNVQRGRDLAVTSNGDVIIVGDTGDDTNLGGGVVVKGNDQDVFVARYKGDDGSWIWSKLFGDASAQVGRNVALGAGGDVLITGGFAGTINWNANTSMTALGTSDVFVAKLDSATGDYLMHAHGGKTATSAGTAVGSDEAGNVVVFGYFNGIIDFGAQAVTANAGANDTFVVKLRGSDWQPVWTKSYGAAGSQYGWDVAVAKNGSAMTVGGFYTELDVPPLQKVLTTGGSDIFAVFVDP